MPHMVARIRLRAGSTTARTVPSGATRNRDFRTIPMGRRVQNRASAYANSARSEPSATTLPDYDEEPALASKRGNCRDLAQDRFGGRGTCSFLERTADRVRRLTELG